MYSLNKQQVNIIIADVKRADITFNHLEDDLVDHICCEAEALISEGKTFKQAYDIIKTQTGISVLKKIQENTKFLIDKKYRLMKTTIKITGSICLAMLGFGTVFKILHLPGAGLLLVFGFMALCIAFFPMAVYVNYNNASKKKNLFLHISILFGGILFMTGVIFKIQHWPGSSMLLLLGYILLLFMFIPSLLFARIKQSQSAKEKRIYVLGIFSIIIFGLSSVFKMFHWPGASILMLTGSTFLICGFLPLFTWHRVQLEGKITGQFIFTIIVSMFLVIFTSLLALNVSNDVLGGFVNQKNNISAINNYLDNKNATLLLKINNNKDTLDLQSKALTIQQQSDDLYLYLNKLQNELIKLDTKISTDMSVRIFSNTDNRNGQSKVDAAFTFLLNKDNKSKATELKEKLQEYKTNINSIFNNDAEFHSKINSIINVSDKQLTGKVLSWENYNFYYCSTIRAINILKEIQSDVLRTETISLENLNNTIVNH